MRRSAAVLAIALALTLPAGSAAMATAGPVDTGSVSTTHGKIVKPLKKRTIVRTGRLAAVDAAASTIALIVRSGRDRVVRLDGLTLSVSASARITRNHDRVTLADLAVGDRVLVTVRQVGATGTVTRILAVSPPVASPTSTPTPAVTPSATPSPASS